MPSAIATVLYPAGSDATFDMDYYLKTHMPLVQETWGPEGLRAWKIVKSAADSQYSVQATLEFPDMKTLQAAAGGPTAKKVMEDISNFSNKQPVIIMGEVMDESK